MKDRLLLIMFMFVLATGFAAAVQAPAINVTLMNQEPDPVMPGEYVELRFMILNTMADTVARNFQVQLDPQYPFSLDPGEEAIQSLGDMPATGLGRNTYIVKFKLRVDEKAVEGSNKVVLKYKHGTSDWIGQEFTIDVRTTDANLAIISVSTDPKEIKPGQEVQMRVKVKNMADSTLRDVTLKLDLTFSESLAGSTMTATDRLAAFNALPFAPIGSTTEQKIYSLSPGEEHEFTYNLIALSDAESRIYKMPIKLSYSDEIGTEYDKNDILGVVVGTKPDLAVVLDQSDLYVGKRTGTVTVKFINKGFTDVKFLDVKLANSSYYELLSANEVYIGNVNSDDYETADFQIYLINGAVNKEETIALPLTVEYRDANNKVYGESLNLELKIMSPEKLGMKTNNSGVFIVLLLLIGVGAFFFLRRRKPAKK